MQVQAKRQPTRSGFRPERGPLRAFHVGQIHESAPPFTLLRRMGPMLLLVVVFQAQVGNQGFALDVAQGVFQLHQLNEEIMLRVKPGSRHG
jgi:hypothetical protein